LTYVACYGIFSRADGKADEGNDIEMSKPRVSVTREDENGRNKMFHDNVTGRNMNRAQFVRSIELGNYEDYHVRNVNNIPTPCSNPDKSKSNNLG